MNYERQIRIQVAAFHFTQGKSAAKIGKLVGRNERQIIRWSKLPEWEQVLELLDYQGDRSFRQQPTRKIDTKQVEATHQVWLGFKKDKGVRNAARLTSEATGINLATVRSWERRFGWRESDENV
jgi:transposase